MTRSPALRYLRRVVRERIEQMGLKPFAKMIRVPVGQVRSVRDGRAARSDTIERLTEALGLEHYIGPPRATGEQTCMPLKGFEHSTQELVRLIVESGGNPIPGDLWPVLAAGRSDTLPAPGYEDILPGYQPLPVVQLAAEVGAGPTALEEEVSGYRWSTRIWFEEHRLDNSQCAWIRVRDSSMEPTLPSGCWILLDRGRLELREEGIFVVRTERGLIVRRAERSKAGAWLLVSDNPDVKTDQWPTSAETFGRVVWTERKPS